MADVSAGRTVNPLLKEFGFEPEVIEEPSAGYNNFRYSGFPKPLKRFRIFWERYDMSIEEPYYWILKYLREDSSYPDIIKTEDAFAAAENSAFFGVSQLRLGGQQDKVSQFLATIGKMVKELFQLVRELRILDERIDYYSGSKRETAKPMNQRKKSDEITLKGIFIDMVQGGAKNPASVYGMARELQFTTLPDIFFHAPPLKQNEIDDYVDSLEFNLKVLEVLKRHLKQFTTWKDRTWKEIRSRRTFTIKYLKQHFQIIKMYMTWVKPYLKHVQRLSMKSGMEKDVGIVTAFETSMIDLEFLAHKPYGRYHGVILVTYRYRTKPGMKYVQEAYQRGPIHIGEMYMDVRCYAWTKEQIEKYINFKEKEDLELLKTISESVRTAMESLGNELLKYLEEADNQAKKESPEEVDWPTWRRWVGLPPKVERPIKIKPKKVKDDGSKSRATFAAKGICWLTFKNFKKGHGFIQW